TSQDQISETRGEAFNLGLYALSHVEYRSVWHVTVRPGRVFAGRCTARVEQTGLCMQHVRQFSVLPSPRKLLRYTHFSQRIPQVDCNGPAALWRSPWNRTVKCPV